MIYSRIYFDIKTVLCLLLVDLDFSLLMLFEVRLKFKSKIKQFVFNFLILYILNV